MISGKWRLVQDFFALDGRDIRRKIYEPTYPIPNPIIPNHRFVFCLRQKSSGWLLTNYCKTPIYRASIYRVPRFTGPQFFPLKTSFVCK